MRRPSLLGSCLLVAAGALDLHAQGAEPLLSRNAQVRVWMAANAWVAKEGMLARRRGDTLDLTYMVRAPGTNVVSRERVQVP